MGPVESQSASEAVCHRLRHPPPSPAVMMMTLPVAMVPVPMPPPVGIVAAVVLGVIGVVPPAMVPVMPVVPVAMPPVHLLHQAFRRAFRSHAGLWHRRSRRCGSEKRCCSYQCGAQSQFLEHFLPTHFRFRFGFSPACY